MRQYIIKFNKKIIILMFTLFCCISICGCSRIDIPEIWDYYKECSFSLPFEYQDGNYTGSAIYFSSEYSIEKMCELINNAGYTAELLESDSSSAILITIKKDLSSHYFVVYNNEYNGKYKFTNCTFSLANVHGVNYSILAPTHIIGGKISQSNECTTFEVYSSFKYIADFYRESGKNNFIIDESKKTIKFRCKGKTDLNFVETEVVIQYIETSDVSYLEFVFKSGVSTT